MLKIDKKTLQNFWYYYKMHVIIGSFFLLSIVVIIGQCADRVEADLSIGYLMEPPLSVSQHTRLKEELTRVIQDINHDGEKHVELIAMLQEQQLVLSIAVGQIQAVILYQALFERYAVNGGFQSLDDVVARSELDVEEYPEIRMRSKRDEEPHIYGIPLENNRRLDKIEIDGIGHYAGLLNRRKGSDALYDNADIMIKYLLNTE